MRIDIILDPIAVNKRDGLEPGSFYGIPIKLFWLVLNTAFILSIFIFVAKIWKIKFKNVNPIPAILFSMIPIIASRPCFEKIIHSDLCILFSSLLIYFSGKIQKNAYCKYAFFF